MRVDEPILSIVATRRKAESRSGANAPRACHTPLKLLKCGDEIQDSGVDLELDRADHYAHQYTRLHPFLTPRTTPDHAQFKGPKTRSSLDGSVGAKFRSLETGTRSRPPRRRVGKRRRDQVVERPMADGEHLRFLLSARQDFASGFIAPALGPRTAFI
jgi:hypothetical protein